MLFDPTICAIGEGTKDTEMMVAADVSIEIVSEVELPGQQQSNPNKSHEKLLFSNAADIVVSKVGIIRDLILVEGMNAFFK